MFGSNYFGQPYFGQGYAGNIGIQFDATANSGYQAAASSYSWTHVVGASPRQILVVSIGMFSITDSATAVTFNGVALTKLRADNGATTTRSEIWYLSDPPQGSHTVSVTLASGITSAASSTSYNNVNPISPIDAQNTGTGTTGGGGGTASDSTTTVAAGAWIVDAIATASTAMTVGSNQVQRANISGATGSIGQSDKGAIVTPGATTMQWTSLSALKEWTVSTVSLNPQITSTAYTNALTGSLSFSGNQTRRIAHSLNGSLSFVGAIAKIISKALTASLSFTGAVTKLLFLSKATFTASLSFTGAISRKTLKVLSGGLSFINGFALQFDGSQNYVSLGTMGNFGSSLGSGFYCKFDIKTTYNSATARHIFGIVNTGTTLICELETSNTNLLLRYRDDTGKELSGSILSSNINDGVKHNVEITATPSTNTIVFKVDGNTVATTYGSQQTPVTFATNFQFPMVLAAWNLRGVIQAELNCTLDNFQLGTTASNLFGSYTFNEGTGTTTADISGNANTGTLTGSPLPTWVNGFALSTDGLTKQTNKILTGILSWTGSLQWLAAKGLVATLNFTGSLAKRSAKGLVATLTTAGNLTKKVLLPVAAILSFEGLVRHYNIYIVLSSSLSFVGNLNRRVSRIFTASLSFAGSLIGAIIKAYNKILNATRWRPRSGKGFVLPTGGLKIVTKAGLAVVNKIGLFVIENPTYVTPQNATTWAKTGKNQTQWRQSTVVATGSLRIVTKSGLSVVTKAGLFVVENPTAVTPKKATVWNPSAA